MAIYSVTKRNRGSAMNYLHAANSLIRNVSHKYHYKYKSWRTKFLSPFHSVCPEDMEVLVPNGTASVPVFFDPCSQRCIDCCDGDYNIIEQTEPCSCSPASGSELPVGTTTVKCDLSSCHLCPHECQFNVTVKEGILRRDLHFDQDIYHYISLWDLGPVHKTEKKIKPKSDKIKHNITFHNNCVA